MKKLMIFLMVAIPLVIIILVNFTVDIVIGNVSISVDRIELDKTSITANVDDIVSLNATIYPSNATNQEIIWASTNEEVARIDLDGNVTFVGFGNGYITATTADGNKMASCYYYVTDTVVHEVKLSTPKSQIHVGSSVQLSVEILPNEAINKNVTFHSSDPNIAIVDQNGLVSGLKVGYVTITAIAEEGGYTDFINLAVINPVTDIVLNTDYAITAEENYSIGYQIYPSNATNTNVSFEVDNPEVATVNNLGQVSFLQAGEVKVTLTTQDGGFQKTITIVYTAGYAKSLTLDKYSISATIGDPAQVIDYTTSPSYLTKTEVTFSSTNNEVAYVSNGYLYFVGGGNATITARVESAEGEYITQTIMVYVESPATGILIDNIVTAEKTVQLTPTSFPNDSTNNKFFYHCSSAWAKVDESGLVTFETDSPTTVEVTIFANSDYSETSTTISIEYTAGRAISFEPVDKDITINYGDLAVLEYQIYPTNTSTRDIQVSILSQTNNAGSGNVVEIMSDGTIRGIGGGRAEIQVALTLLNGERQTHKVAVEVLKDAEDIEISIDLDQLEGIYVTAENTVSFNYNVLPSDASDKSVTWSVDEKSMAVILGQTLRFNQTGVVTLIGTTASGHSQSVQIRYTGSYPISAEVGAFDGEITTQIPAQIEVGKSFSVVIDSIFPSNTLNRNITLSVSNQSTASPLGKVLEISGTTVNVVAGGQATLTVYISSTVVLSFQITALQKVQSLSVSPAFIQTTNSSVALKTTILPIDATNKNVVFEVLTPEIAYIQDGVLYFTSDGVAQIIARSEENSEINFTFTIEKIERGVSVVEPTIENLEMMVGDKVRFNLTDTGVAYSSYNIVVDEDSAGIVAVENGTITALTSGQASLVVNLYNGDVIVKSYNLTINVVQLVENIVYNGTIEEYNSYLTTANDTLSLDFLALPSSATNSTLEYEIVSSYNSNGQEERIASIMNGKLYWTKSGTLTLKVSSADQNVSKTFNFRYTGGDALNAVINVDEEISLNVGEKIKIEVTSWIPSDTTNKLMLINEISHTSGVSVIQIDSASGTITALNGGFSQIVVELSNGITKNIVINVIKKASSISVSNDNIITASSSATISATVLPSTATNKMLEYKLKEGYTFASLVGNEVVFTQPGTVVVIISTTDGSNISKEVSITSTMGYLYSITLSTTERTITKGSAFSLYVTDYLPHNATQKDITYTILSQATADGSNQDVISLVQSGSSYLIEGLYGGSAVVRVQSVNKLGQIVYQDCSITVHSPVENISIEFVDQLEFYQNYYVTSKNQIKFNEIVYPLDATIRDFDYKLSDTSRASVENGVITFNKTGTVTITFTSKDKTNGEKSVSYIFYYCGDNLLEASLDLGSFENRVAYLNAGQELQLNLSKKVPNDNTNIKFAISNLTENRVDSSKAVIEFEDGVIRALNGGRATFALSVNNINLGNFTVVVERGAEEISIEKETVYISIPGYQIVATVLPTDATDKEIAYQSNNSLATVDNYGAVEFSGFGIATIKIYLKSNPSIYREITIQYTKDIKGISFTETKTQMYVGEYVNLSVIPEPIDAEGFTYTFSLDNDQVASLRQINGSYQLLGLAPGQVRLTLSVDGTDISYSKVFTFFTKLYDIRLELDNIDDAYGLGGYRVFGNKFYTNGEFVNHFNMNYTTNPSGNYANLIEWESSDEDIAVVDNQGQVSFVGTGIVTITARQIAPYAGANTVSDYYTFKVVNGINLYNVQDYPFVIERLFEINQYLTNNYCALVLQNDINVTNEVSNIILYNIYGNGHMLDYTKYSYYIKMQIERSNIFIDNVVLRGATFSSDGALSELDGAGKLMLITGNAKNVLIYNTIIENAFILVEVNSSEATFKGCIIRNSYSGGLVISRKKDSTFAPVVTVEDCIFARSLLSCIQLAPDLSTELKGYESKLIIKGNLYMYNWLTLDEFQGGTLLDFFADYGLASVGESIINKIKQRIQEAYADYKYTYNGKDYYMLGILNLYANIQGLFTYQSNAIIDRSQMNTKFNYVDANLTGAISEFGIIADYNFALLTFLGENPYIKPGTTYEGNQVILADIVQPIRKEYFGF